MYFTAFVSGIRFDYAKNSKKVESATTLLYIIFVHIISKTSSQCL
jgi:hypothetical protein